MAAPKHYHFEDYEDTLRAFKRLREEFRDLHTSTTAREIMLHEGIENLARASAICEEEGGEEV